MDRQSELGVCSWIKFLLLVSSLCVFGSSVCVASVGVIHRSAKRYSFLISGCFSVRTFLSS